MERWEKAASEGVTAIGTSLPNLAEAPLPEVVYHYTDLAGLLGILEAGSLWATDYRYLNDSSELRYVYRLGAEVARGLLRAGDRGPIAVGVLEEIATGIPPWGDPTYYLTCFSEIDNSLSQWRAYGSEQGFSLAFPGDVTHREGCERTAARQGQSPGITLQKVIYDLDEQTDYVTGFISRLVDLCESPGVSEYPEERQAVSDIAPFYWGQLQMASYRFKHPDFADEREWRLVSWLHETQFFRAGRTITPYAKFRLLSATHPPPFTGGLPLLSVRHGPTALPRETSVALDRLLTSKMYAPEYCERLGSDTPLRVR